MPLKMVRESEIHFECVGESAGSILDVLVREQRVLHLYWWHFPSISHTLALLYLSDAASYLPNVSSR